MIEGGYLPPVYEAPRSSYGERSNMSTSREAPDPEKLNRRAGSVPASTCECGSKGNCRCASAKGNSTSGSAGAVKELTEEEKAEVARLQKQDQEIRAHEQAHAAAAGPLAQGGPQYEYTTGPDGKKYAVSGHVNIDTSPGKTPEETIKKAEQIKRAALAPAEPSPQDIKIAAKAAQMQAKAENESITEKGMEGSEAPGKAVAEKAGPLQRWLESIYANEQEIPGMRFSAEA